MRSILHLSTTVLLGWVLAGVLSSGLLLAQVAGNGVIQGTITDTSGAVVPGATVTGTNINTGAKITRQTTGAGFYVLSPLAAGQYMVTVSKTGFKTSVAKQVTVNALNVVGLNLVLNVGATTQEVTVTAAPPALDTTNGTLGVTISNKAYTSLPLAMNGAPENPEGFIYLLPGVENGSGFVGNINGGEAFSKEIYIDGLPVVTSQLQGDYRNLTTATSVETVDQFQIDTNGTPAYYEGQGTENYVFKSGTNQLHGDGYEFLRNTALDTRGFFSAKTPLEIQNEFGGSVGGPILKNRLFFFANYDAYRLRSGAVPSFYSLPTAAERNGDFSALLPSQPIYDPSTTNCNSAGVCTRQAFPGNIVPQADISPISTKLQSYLPATINPNVQNNFLNAFTSGTDQNDYTAKVDATPSDKDHLWGVTQWGRNFPVGLPPNGGPELPLPYASSRYGATVTWLEQFNDTYTISPHVLNVFGFSFNRYITPFINPTEQGNYAAGAGIKGLPPGQASEAFPSIGFGGPNSPTEWANNTYTEGFTELNNTYVFQDNLQWVRGNHSLTFGTQLIFFEGACYIPTGGGAVTGLDFNNTETAGFDPSGTLLTNTGSSYASYLLGTVDNGSLLQNAAGETGERNRNYAFYAQDDWKVSRRLTLNMGLRWEIPTPYVEEFNRESWFNPTLPNSAVDGYPGALQFAGYGLDSCQCRTDVQTHFRDFGPRIGFAYELTPKTVVRGAYGIFYYNAGALGGSAAQEGTGILGFEASPTFTSLNAGISPAFNWNSGFPAYTPPPFFEPTLNSGFNTATPSGGTVTYDEPQLGGISPYTENWNFTVQRELSSSTVLTASYAASSSHYQPTGIGNGIYSDQIQPKYMALGNLLLASATPGNIAAAQAVFPGVHLPYANFSGSIGQMLLPFPQYASVGDPFGDIGNANFNSLQVSAQRNFSSGLQFLISYTLSKEIDDAGSNLGGFYGAGGRTAYNNKLSKSVGGQDIPNDIVMSYVYQLPFGAGHKLSSNNKVADALISGWRFSGIQTYIQSTPLGPIGANCDVPYTGGCYADYAPNFTGPVRINGSYGSGNLLGATPPAFLNINAFAEPASFTFGNTPRTLPYDLRGPWGFNEDFSLIRDIKLGERLTFEIQGDVFNAFNRVQFGAPATAINAANFGQIGSQANTPRQFQFNAHLFW
jgi:hypothetical protein